MSHTGIEGGGSLREEQGQEGTCLPLTDFGSFIGSLM